MTGRGLVSLLLVGYALGACGGSDSPPNEPTGIGPEGGSLEIEGATLIVPPGAVPEGVRVEASVSEATVPAPNGLEVRGRLYAFTPHGTQFEKPVTIRLPIVAEGARVYTLDDDDDRSWAEVPGTVERQGNHELEVEHISLFAELAATDGAGGNGGNGGNGGGGSDADGQAGAGAGGRSPGGDGGGGQPTQVDGGSSGAAGSGGGEPAADRIGRICMGYSHGCAIVEDGKVKCWGGGPAGQLGDGEDYSGEPQYRTSAAFVSGLTGAVQLACGAESSSALLEDGSVVSWGRGDQGQLGNGMFTLINLTPQPSSITNAVQLSSGGSQLCAVLEDRTVRCWGRGDFGQLGDGVLHTNPANVATPQVVGGVSGVLEVSVGFHHACALLEDRTVTCWGYNSKGQLGVGTPTMRATAAAVPGLSDVRHIAAGDEHTCALLDTGAITCWGLGDFGQRGDGTFHTEDPNPTRSTVQGTTQHAWLKAGFAATCSFDNAGSPYCWGFGSTGLMGNGMFYTIPVGAPAPASVDLPAQVEDLAYYTDTACARLHDQSVWCWGSGIYGALGDGVDRPLVNGMFPPPAEAGVAVPVKVLGVP